MKQKYWVNRFKVLVILFISLLIIHFSDLMAKDYYVATNGDDQNDGRSLEAPFRTIQKAASGVAAGDTVYIRGGSYHEEVLIQSKQGTEDNPITFKSYNSEVVTLDGTQSVEELGSNGWRKYKENIYFTTIDRDIWQLIVDGEWMINARWPNANFDDGSIWKHQSRAVVDGDKSSDGVLVDNPVDGISLAESGIDMTGGLLIGPGIKSIVSHSAGSDTLELSSGGYPVDAILLKEKWNF